MSIADPDMMAREPLAIAAILELAAAGIPRCSTPPKHIYHIYLTFDHKGKLANLQVSRLWCFPSLTLVFSAWYRSA